MKKLAYIFAFSFLALLIVRCEKEIPFEGEIKEPKLVVNSLFTSDSSWKVHLSYSLSVIDNGEPGVVTDGQVNILDESGNLIETLQHDSAGFYTSPNGTFPIPGNIYRMEASAPNYTTVTSADILPSPIQILSVDTQRVTYQGDPRMEVTVTFQDPPGEENYYSLRIPIMESYIFYTDTNTFNYLAYMQTNDPSVEADAQDNYFTELLFRDNLFDGNTYTLKFYMDIYLFEGYRGYGSEVSADIQMFSCSAAFFRYRESYNRYRYTYGDPFAQPVQVYSNIENGFGIFGGGSSYLAPLIR